MLRQDPTAPLGGQLGAPLPIRSDEWLTHAPDRAGELLHGSSMHPPLSQQPDLIYQISSGRFFESLLFLDGNLLRLGPWLPDAVLFAAYRGCPWLLLFLALPPLLRRLGATRPMSWLAVALCFLAPASIWWSFMPMRILGVRGRRHLLALPRQRPGGATPLGAGACSPGWPGSAWAAWSPSTCLVPHCRRTAVVAAGAFMLREQADRRVSLLTIGIGATIGAVVLGGTLWENWAALHAELNTLYPGQRRVTGSAELPLQLFGAPGLTELEDDPAPFQMNQSEISSAFLVCGLWAAVLWTTARRAASRAQWAAVTAVAVVLVVTSAWAMVSWGSLGEHVPLLNTVLPSRAAQTVGYPAAILVCLVLSRLQAGATRLALCAAVVCAAVTAYGVSSLRSALPNLGAVEVWATVAVVGVLVWSVTRWPSRALPVVAVTGTLLVAGYDANPVIFGLGDLRGTSAAARAEAFGHRAEEAGDRWAADSLGARRSWSPTACRRSPATR